MLGIVVPLPGGGFRAARLSEEVEERHRLGFPNPEREQVKARLTLQIYRLIRSRGLTQAAAGEILGIRQPHVSGLMRGQSGNFSVERLLSLIPA